MFSSIWANYSLLPIIFSLFSHESATVLLLKKNDLLTLCSRLYAYLPVLIYLRLTQLTRYCSALLFSSRGRAFNVFFVFVFSSERKRTYRVEPPSPRRREGGGAIWGFVVLTLLFLSCGFPLCHLLALS